VVRHICICIYIYMSLGFKRLNGLVRFAERRNMVFARVPSHFKRSLQITGGPEVRKGAWVPNVLHVFDFLVGPLVRGENKGKGKMSPYNRLRKPRGGVEVYPYSFFNLGARWDWMFNVTPRPLYPREKPGTHCIGGWVGLRAGLDWCGKSRPPP